MNEWHYLTEFSPIFKRRAGHVSEYIESVDKMFVFGGENCISSVVLLLLTWQYKSEYRFRDSRKFFKGTFGEICKAIFE